MGEPPKSPAPNHGDQPSATPQQLQALAHSRGRICKVRGCTVCEPLREQRRLKKARRKAEARAQLHAKGQPCGRANCPEPACVRARHADEATPPAPTATRPVAESAQDLDAAQRHRAERHRVGLPCGSEDCPRPECVQGFDRHRTRRHRAGRPCGSAECANPICVAGRST